MSIKEEYHSIKNAILSYLLMRNVENKEKTARNIDLLTIVMHIVGCVEST